MRKLFVILSRNEETTEESRHKHWILQSLRSFRMTPSVILSRAKNPVTLTIIFSSLFIAILAGFIFRNQITTFFSGSPGNDPIAYWKFDEAQGSTANDSEGTYDGTVTNATWKSEDSCVSNSCLSFDGSGDYVNVGVGPSSVQSISMWMRPITTTEHLLDLNGTAYLSTAGGILSATGFTTPQIYVNGILTNTITQNRWQHVTVTTSSAINASDIEIGRLAGTDDFRGYIDDVKLYDYARSAAHVKADLAGPGSTRGVAVSFGSEGTGLLDNLAAYWKMDESSWVGTAGEIIDSTGNNNSGTGIGDATTAAGKYGSAGTFDGSDDYVEFNENVGLNPSATVSIAMWVNPDAVASEQTLIGRWDEAGDERSYRMFINSSAKLCGEISSDGTSGTVYQECSSTSITASTLTHVAMTTKVLSNGNIDMQLYIGGTEDGTTTSGSAVTSIYSD